MCNIDIHRWWMCMKQCVCAAPTWCRHTLLLRSQTVCIHTVTVDSCFSFNKIRLKKLVVHSLICHLTEGATWGLALSHLLWMANQRGFDSHRDERSTQRLQLHKPINERFPSQKEPCLEPQRSFVVSCSVQPVLHHSHLYPECNSKWKCNHPALLYQFYRKHSNSNNTNII